MHHFRPLHLVLMLAAACTSGGDDAAGAAADTAARADAPAATGEQDLADITGYRLTMEKVDRYFAAQRNMALRMKDMSPAERERMDMSGTPNDGLDDIARNIERNPAIAGAVRDAGLTPREFATLTMSFMQSAMAASVMQMRPNDDQDSLAREMKANIDNVRFFREHEAELTRKQEALEADLRRLGVTEES